MLREYLVKGFAMDDARLKQAEQWDYFDEWLVRRAALAGEPGDWLLARLAEKPDLTMRALTSELAARGVDVAHDTVWRFVRRAGQTVKKKTLMAAEQQRPKVARFRARWKAHQHRLDPMRLIFIDETWIKTNMTRTCGWAARGQRLTAHVPHGHWKTLTFLAGLRHDQIVAPFVLDGPIDGDAFTAWVSQCLTPTLAPGDVVIAGNLGSHKGASARQLIRDAGAHLLFLPPCSPAPCVAKNSPPGCFLNAPHPSKWSSPSSRLCSERPTSAPSKLRGEGSEPFSTPSPQPNARTTFAMRDTLQSETERL